MERIISLRLAPVQGSAVPVVLSMGERGRQVAVQTRAGVLVVLEMDGVRTILRFPTAVSSALILSRKNSQENEVHDNLRPTEPAWGKLTGLFVVTIDGRAWWLEHEDGSTSVDRGRYDVSPDSSSSRSARAKRRATGGELSSAPKKLRTRTQRIGPIEPIAVVEQTHLVAEDVPVDWAFETSLGVLCVSRSGDYMFVQRSHRAMEWTTAPASQQGMGLISFAMVLDSEQTERLGLSKSFFQWAFGAGCALANSPVLLVGTREGVVRWRSLRSSVKETTSSVLLSLKEPIHSVHGARGGLLVVGIHGTLAFLRENHGNQETEKTITLGLGRPVDDVAVVGTRMFLVSMGRMFVGILDDPHLSETAALCLIPLGIPPAIVKVASDTVSNMLFALSSLGRLTGFPADTWKTTERQTDTSGVETIVKPVLAEIQRLSATQDALKKADKALSQEIQAVNASIQFFLQTRPRDENRRLLVCTIAPCTNQTAHTGVIKVTSTLANHTSVCLRGGWYYIMSVETPLTTRKDQTMWFSWLMEPLPPSAQWSCEADVRIHLLESLHVVGYLCFAFDHDSESSIGSVRRHAGEAFPTKLLCGGGGFAIHLQEEEINVLRVLSENGRLETFESQVQTPWVHRFLHRRTRSTAAASACGAPPTILPLRLVVLGSSLRRVCHGHECSEEEVVADLIGIRKRPSLGSRLGFRFTRGSLRLPTGEDEAMWTAETLDVSLQGALGVTCAARGNLAMGLARLPDCERVDGVLCCSVLRNIMEQRRRQWDSVSARLMRAHDEHQAILHATRTGERANLLLHKRFQSLAEDMRSIYHALRMGACGYILVL